MRRQFADGRADDRRLVLGGELLADVGARVLAGRQFFRENQRVRRLAAGVGADEVDEYLVESREEGRAAGEEADALDGALERAEGVVLRIRLVAAQADRRLVEAIAVFGHQAARPCSLVGHDLLNQIHYLLDEGRTRTVRRKMPAASVG